MAAAPFADLLASHPWLAAFASDLLPTCPDCGAALGEPHGGGCDVARCRVCGGQRPGCRCPDGGGDLWRGLMYFDEHKACVERGLWCRDDVVAGRTVYHIPCGPDAPGAHADLNRALLHLHVRRTPPAAPGDPT